MLVKVGDTHEPVFKLDDLDRFMDRDIFDAVKAFTTQEIEEAQESTEMYKEMYEAEERVSDERYQIINSGIQGLVGLRDELKSLQRFNRNQIIDRLNNIIGELENF